MEAFCGRFGVWSDWGVGEGLAWTEVWKNEEILRVVKELEGDKTPGPDGFSMVFYHHCWGVVEINVLAVFEEFYQDSKFEKSLNATLIALIPKKNGASNIWDFRPISMGGVYTRSWLRFWQTAWKRFWISWYLSLIIVLWVIDRYLIQFLLQTSCGPVRCAW